MRKILILGGKPIGSTEIVQRAKELGYYVIVTDYLAIEDSPAKLLSDENWIISTADIDLLYKKCVEEKVEGVFTGVHEFNIEMMIKLCNLLGFPCYVNINQWDVCTNKKKFKALCNKYSIPNSKEYEINILEKDKIGSVNFPVIVKPVDSSGSRGFHICHNADELVENYNKSLIFSPSKNILIEQYQPYDSVIIHYTIKDGEILYSGISDKMSVKFKSTGSSVMGVQLFPSVNEKEFLEHFNSQITKMLASLNLRDCALWIEAFNNRGQFILNEMGLRFGGSLTFFPVEYYYGINQLDMLLKFQMSENYNGKSYTLIAKKSKYCILPLHIKTGVISLENTSELLGVNSHIKALVKVHNLGDTIQNWGSAQQVYCYLHIEYCTKEELKKTVLSVLRDIKVFDEYGDNMVYSLFNIESL